MEADRDILGSHNESVWDYPRPPRVEQTARRVRVIFGGELVADSRRALRVLETSHPPVYYIPADDVRREFLRESEQRTECEFKGTASYYCIEVNDMAADDVAWYYPAPAPGYEAIRDHIAFYPGRVEACYVDEERVIPQSGGFYGGWITRGIVGPFKGAPGTGDW